MPLFRRKPTVVEAVQWFPGKTVPGVAMTPDREQPPRAFVVTIHGQQAFLAPGDWVIGEPDGKHYYPVRPDIFAATYEEVES